MTRGPGPLRDDSGATAVITAVVASVLFAVAALAVDMGNAYARDARIDAVADQAALAAARALPDPCAAVRAAADLLVAEGNDVLDDTPDGLLTSGQVAQNLTDGVPANGSIEIESPDGLPVVVALDSSGNPLPGTDCTRVGSSARVVTPTATVAFGLAAVMGFDAVEVQGAATAALISPLPVLPFAIPQECADGQERTYVLSPPTSGPTASPVPAGHVFDPVGTLDPAILQVDPATAADVASGQVTATVTGAVPVGTWDWYVEFSADGISPAQVTARLDPAVPAGFPSGGGPDAFTAALPPGVTPGTWSVRVGRVDPTGTSPSVWSSNSVPVDVAGSVQPRACSEPGTFGDVLMLTDVGALGGAAANGLTEPVRLGESVVVAGLDIQRAEAGTLSNGLLTRFARPGPECGPTPSLNRGTWLVGARQVTATNHTACYDVVATDTDGVPGADTWAFADPTLLEDPRLFLIPVVDLDPIAVSDPAFPSSAVTVTVTGYRIGYVTDETPASVGAGAPIADCSAPGTLTCSGITLAGTSGPVERITIVAFDPAGLTIGGGVRLRDNGHPWLTGPLPDTAPRDVHLIE